MYGKYGVQYAENTIARMIKDEKELEVQDKLFEKWEEEMSNELHFDE